MARKLNIGNAILCEYVAMGSNNKRVLVNVFSGDVLVQTFPASLAFSAYIEVIRRDTADLNLSMEVTLDKKILVKGDIAMSGGGAHGVIMLPQLQVQIDGPSAIEIVLAAKGYSRAVALSKQVYQGPLAEITI